MLDMLYFSIKLVFWVSQYLCSKWHYLIASYLENILIFKHLIKKKKLVYTYKFLSIISKILKETFFFLSSDQNACFFSGYLNCTAIKSFTYMQNKLWVGGTGKAFIEVSILSCFLPHYSVLYQVSINVFHIHVCYCCCILNAELRDHMVQHSSFTWENFDQEWLAQGSQLS